MYRGCLYKGSQLTMSPYKAAIRVHRQQMSKPARRNMASVNDSIPHVVRTAEDPRQAGLHAATISRIELVNDNIRLFRLSPSQGPVRHLPGQYVDLHIPDIETVGGFTITSPPQTALRKAPTQASTAEDASPDWEPYIELAVQRAPKNPPAAYLYEDPASLMGATVSIRVGGSFTYPPYTLSRQDFENISNVVFIAGGVGINPIMSILSTMALVGDEGPGGMKKRVRLLYSAKRETTVTDSGNKQQQEILFERRLELLSKQISNHSKVDFKYILFETGSSIANIASEQSSKGDNPQVLHRRMTPDDLLSAVGPPEIRQHTLVYVCGLPSMTDDFVKLLQSTEGLDEKRVLCEKWW